MNACPVQGGVVLNNLKVFLALEFIPATWISIVLASFKVCLVVTRIPWKNAADFAFYYAKKAFKTLALVKIKLKLNEKVK